VLVWENGIWNFVVLPSVLTILPSVLTDGQKNGKLILNILDNVEKLEYWTHYTIAKFADGDFVTFDYEDDPRVANFPATLEMEPGYYMLSTGNRYHDGETLSQLEFFNIEAGKTVNKMITLRELTPRNRTYGTIDVNYKVSLPDKPTLLKELMHEKELILCFIDPMREPTRHLFNDMAALKNDFEKWNGNILFMIPSDKNTADFSQKQWNLPVNVSFGIDEEAMFMSYVLTTTNQYFREEYPLVFIVNKESAIVFKSEGYRIGTGELLLKSLK
jgi:hypothetical protein